MVETRLSTAPIHRRTPLIQLRVWHLSLFVLYVGIAIVNIQDQRPGAPVLIALASAGFAGYGILAWLFWRIVVRFEARLGMLPLLILYLTGMAALFLAATVVYLVIERVHDFGHFGTIFWDLLG